MNSTQQGPSVRVTADEQGNVIGQSPNNPEYGYVRVESITPVIGDGGWFRMQKRSALIKGKMEDLTAANFQKDMLLPGKIIVKESLQPFNPQNPDKHLKFAGDSGIVCRVEDEPIYRETEFTSNINAIDSLIPHTNADEIKQKQAAENAISKLKGSKPSK